MRVFQRHLKHEPGQKSFQILFRDELLKMQQSEILELKHF